MVRVLFTGGGGPGSEALWRLLGDRYELHFADADHQRIDPSIPSGRRHTLPWAADPAFAGQTVDLCRQLRLDVLVPAVDEELLALSQARSALAPTGLLLPSTDYIATMLDKLRMATTLASRGIQVPATRLMADGLEGLAYPCVAKPRVGRGSRGVRFLEDRAAAETLAALLGKAAEDMLLQEKIGGTEYTVQMLADSAGHLHTVVPVRVLLKRGVTIHGVTDPDPRVIATCSAIHQALPAGGCYNIQLMLAPDGRVLPFEINPRVSTTLCLAVAAGIDPIAVFLALANRGNPNSFAAGVQLRRHWRNHFMNGEGT